MIEKLRCKEEMVIELLQGYMNSGATVENAIAFLSPVFPQIYATIKDGKVIDVVLNNGETKYY